MEFDQDLCKQNSTLRSFVPLAMFFPKAPLTDIQMPCKLSHAERTKAPLVWIKKGVIHSFDHLFISFVHSLFFQSGVLVLSMSDRF